MSVLIRAIECFVLAVVFGLLPMGIGFVLGWIMRGKKNEKDILQQQNIGSKEES